MQPLFYKFSRYINSIPIKSLIRLSGEKGIFPFYHIISDENVIHVKHLYKIRTTREFIRDLDFLLKEYQPIDPTALITNYKNGNFSRPRGFLLTFDDGLSEFYKVIAPILYKKGIPSICFLNAGFIDNKDLFYRYKTSIIIEKLMTSELNPFTKKTLNNFLSAHNFQNGNMISCLYSVNYLNRNLLDEIAGILEIDFSEYLKDYAPYLTTTEIKELINQGFLFGSHSIDHPKYSNLSLQQQVFQTEESISRITRDFNLDYKLFSFPFTDYGLSKSLFNTLFAEGREIIDLSFGCAGLKQDECVKNIQRIPMETGSYSAREIIYGEYIYYLIKAILRKNLIKRK
jgi:peptidoglycan/xylan/chitin deacetylase (PgdA/CDA1 family)